MSNAKEIWDKLSAIDCSEHVEKKGRFNYLSWAWAWHILKKEFPEAQFEKHCNDNGYPYFTDPNGYAFVKVTVRIGDLEASEMLYVMDNKNHAIKNPTSGDVNTSLQRCLVKAIAFFGLGLYIYSGEDLPEDAKEHTEQADPPKEQQPAKPPASKPPSNKRQGATTSFANELKEAALAIDNLDELRTLYTENEKRINDMAIPDKNSAMAMFKQRKAELTRKDK